MKLLIQSAMIFFGTLFAAGVVALGEPAGGHFAIKPMPAAAPVAPPGEAMDLTMAAAPR